MAPEKIYLNFKDILFSENAKHVLVVPGNIFFNFSLDHLISVHIRSKKSCTLLCKRKDLFDKSEPVYVKIDSATDGKPG